MRANPWILVGFLCLADTAAFGQNALTNQLTSVPSQNPKLPSWDVGLTAGLFEANPKQGDGPYDDDWYFQGRYGLSIGRYWGSHLKTELEVAATGEGTRYTQRYANIPGVPSYYPINVQEHYQLNQFSGRMAWQFFENRWVHPYVFGGVAFEAERQRTWVPEQFFFTTGDTRNPSSRIPLSQAIDSGPHTTYRAGVIGGVGTKVYLTPRAYLNTSLLMSQASPSRNVSLIAGFGWEF